MPGRRICGGTHWKHDYEWTPEKRQKCRRCFKLNPLGVSDRVRFFDHVDKNGPGGCWLWTGALKFDGYGLGTLDGVFGLAHRWCWRILRGELPPKPLEFDHLCHVPRCVNPDHLRVVTRQVNMDSRRNSGLCKQGHRLTPETSVLYTWPKTGRTTRRCTICRDAKNAAGRAERHARGLKKPGRKRIRPLI